jgi:cell division protease FtsH
MGGMGGGGNSGMLSTLLTEMSGFSLEHGWWAKRRTWVYKHILRRKPPTPNKRVLTIGATNRIQALDPALLRPGRFDKKIRVDAPDMEGRRDIFIYYLSKIAHDETMDPDILATETVNYTPAAIKYVLNEALRYALFAGRSYTTYKDFRMAQPEHEYGIRSPIRNLTRDDKRRLASHESGHAIAIRLFAPKYRIARITIIRQGGAHGYVSYYPAIEEHDYMSTYESLLNRLRIAVAGRANELEMIGSHSQTMGVSSDFLTIRIELRRMAMAGMFGPLGATYYGGQDLPKSILHEMEKTFKEVLSEVRLIMRQHHDMSEALVKLLMEREELLSDEVEAFFDQYGLYTPKVLIGEQEEIAASQVQ